MPLTRADVDNIEWGALRTKECATAGSTNVVLLKPDELLALTAALREAVELLRKVEWKGVDQYDYEDSTECCPACGGWQPEEDGPRDNHVEGGERGGAIYCCCHECTFKWLARRFPQDTMRHFGHAPDCDLAALLKRFA